MKPLVRKALSFGLRLAVVVAIYTFMARGLDREALAAALRYSVVAAVLAGAVLTLVQAALNTLRWVRIGSRFAAVPGFVPSFFAYAEGLFVNQALPSFIGGDAWRTGRWRSWGVRVSDAVIATLGDRVYGAFGAACLSLVAIALLWPLETLRPWLVAGAGAVGLGGVACVALFTIAVLAPRWNLRPSSAWVGQVVGQLVGRVGRLETRGRDLAFCIATAVAGYILAGLGALVIARSLEIDTPAAVIVCGTALVMLLAMVPITLAGWGIREAGYLALLTPLGVPPEKAVLLGVAVGLQSLIASLLGGVSLLGGMAAPRR